MVIVKRMSQYAQPASFASASAMSDMPLNFDSATRPLGDCAISSATRSRE